MYCAAGPMKQDGVGRLKRIGRLAWIFSCVTCAFSLVLFFFGIRQSGATHFSRHIWQRLLEINQPKAHPLFVFGSLARSTVTRSCDGVILSTIF